jgi:hypothetical protein
MPNWEVVKTDSGPDRAHVGETAFDSLGNIHFVWNVDFDSIGWSWYRVMYANNSTGEWVKQQVSAPTWLGGMGSGGVPGFDVQKNGTAHIIYQGEPYCDTECVAFYVRNDGLNSTDWITDTVPKPARTLWQYGACALEVDVNDRVHLLTVGCSHEFYCGPWPGWRNFYYSKQAEDSVWQGPELIPDTTLEFRGGITQLSVDEWGSPYASYAINPGRVYFTDRKDEVWQEPYQILDTTFTYHAGGFCFVLDSKGQGHGAFAGALFEFQAQDDSLEIFYYGAPLTSVEDTLEDQRKFRFELFQNYPNPFNANTVIHYCLKAARSTHASLKIYNILGKEVRELVNTRQSSGSYTIIWDGKDNSGEEVSSGIYFYQLRAGHYKQTRKLVLLR